MSTNRTAYVEARDALLERITATLKSDERFIAAWLAGSFARGEQSWCSDLDLHVVVAKEYSETLCAQPWPSGARTTGERLTLFQQFGEPAVVYDAHANNLVGGTFTYVLYKESGVNVDWMLFPLAYFSSASARLLKRNRQRHKQSRESAASFIIGEKLPRDPVAVVPPRQRPVSFALARSRANV